MIAFFSRHPGIRALLLCALTAGLLVLSYPSVDCGPLIWIALVPWLFAIDGPKKGRAFGWSYLAGLLFFSGALYWFLFVTIPGGIALFVYLALYFALFGLACAYFHGRPLWLRCLALPSVWVALEFSRGNLFSGFGWVNLAHSQYQNWLFIQIADITGVYGISFLVVLVNVIIKENLSMALSGAEVPLRGEVNRANLVVLVILLVVFGYGILRMTMRPPMDMLKVGVVQGNIPQDEKWILSQRGTIIDQYLRLSEQAVDKKPDLLIWPETAFPGFAAETPELMERIREFSRRTSIPLLMGIVTEADVEYFNSAVLISKEGEIGQQYDKLHLVPFGEYLPFRKQIPFLIDWVPIDDFSAGSKPTVFEQTVDSVPRPVKFATAICFEDTLAYIARTFVKGGAELLVNMTNDAWFGDSKEPFMHLQASLFRSVETKRSLVRSANTGVSCAIDPYGRILKFIQNDRGKKTYIEKAEVFWVPLNTEITLYTKIGDVFTYLCFVCILWTGYLRNKFTPRLLEDQTP